MLEKLQEKVKRHSKHNKIDNQYIRLLPPSSLLLRIYLWASPDLILSPKHGCPALVTLCESPPVPSLAAVPCSAASQPPPWPSCQPSDWVMAAHSEHGQKLEVMGRGRAISPQLPCCLAPVRLLAWPSSVLSRLHCSVHLS